MLVAKFNKNREFEATTLGDRLWILNRKYHRENGPAVERYEEGKYWCIDGNLYPRKEFDAELKRQGLRQHA